MNYKSFADLSHDITQNLFKLHNEDYDLIVGIPRSGMIPAYMIGLYLNVHVTSLDAFIDNRKLITGSTRSAKDELEFAWDATKVLLVDDSINTGKSLVSALGDIPEEYKGDITTCAIYSDTRKREDVNIYLEYVPMPRVFEWNIFHRKLIESACLDIDGVLCIDPTEHQNDDGDRYIDFTLNAKPLYIPSSKVNALVTSRLEKYRSQTEQWLRDNKVEYDKLIMLDLPTKEERQRLGAHASHKANYYIKSETTLFIESEPSQALAIMEASGKPVYCTGDNTMYSPNLTQVITKSPKTAIKRIKGLVASRIPPSLRNRLKPIYNSLVINR